MWGFPASNAESYIRGVSLPSRRLSADPSGVFTSVMLPRLPAHYRLPPAAYPQCYSYPFDFLGRPKEITRELGAPYLVKIYHLPLYAVPAACLELARNPHRGPADFATMEYVGA